METNSEILKQSIINIAVEAWRFKRVFMNAMGKLDAGESTKYLSQYNWFNRKVNSALEDAGLRIVNIEGQLFDVGMPITPINLDDFSSSDSLNIEQMIEPIIMENDVIVRSGTAILGRVTK
jgi:hypothetical protein